MKMFVALLTVLVLLIFTIMLFGGMIYCGFHEWTHDFMISSIYYFVRLILIGIPSLMILVGIWKIIDDFSEEI